MSTKQVSLKWSIKRINLIWLIQFLPFIELSAIQNNISLGLFMRITLINSVVIILTNLLEIKKVSIIAKLISLFCLLVMIFTYMNGAMQLYNVYLCISLSAFCLHIDRGFRKAPIFVIRFIEKFYGAVLVITLLFQIFARGIFGAAELSGNFYNFWATDNEIGYVYIPFLLTTFLSRYAETKTIDKKSVMYLVLTVLSVIIAWSGACVIGMLIMIFNVVAYKLDFDFFTYKRSIILYIVIFLSVVVFNIFDVFSFFIEGVLGKDMTLSGRTLVWPMAIQDILKNGFIGYGINELGRLTIYKVWAGMDAISAHGYFLEWVLQSGYLGLMCLIGMIIACGAKIKSIKDEKITKVIVGMLFAMLIMYTTEGWIYHYFQYIIYFTIFYAPNILARSNLVEQSDFSESMC